MINLNFTEKELETLKEYFQSELYKAEQTIDNIRGILGKIGNKYGKVQKSFKKAEKKLEKRGRKKLAEVTAKVKAVTVKEKKKPGPKPKAVKAIDIAGATKVLKKRGRPAKVKVTVAAVPVVKAKTVKVEKPKVVKKTAPKVKAVKVKATPKVKVVKAKAAPTAEVVKRKAGRPKKNVEVVAEKKTKVAKLSAKPAVKTVKAKAKAVAAEKKTAPKKVVKAPKVPWGDWILTVLRDSENNLSQEQIFSAIGKRLQLNGEEFVQAEKKLKDQMTKLLKSRKILASAEKENPSYSLKIAGKGL